MKAAELLNYVPESILNALCIEYNVNHQVKKLDGLTMFQLLLYSFLTTRENSYRVMEEFYHSLAFAKLGNKIHKGVKYNSLRDRLIAINPSYFEAIFKYCFTKFESQLQTRQNIVLFDSTLVALSSKILEQGIRINPQGNKRFIKFSMALKHVPIHAKVFTGQIYASEDVALYKAITSCSLADEDIVVFDRGISSRKVFESLSKDNYQFVTRLNPNARHKVIKQYTVPKDASSHLKFESDQQVELFDKQNKPTISYLRLIKCVDKNKQVPLVFLTNMKELTALEVADIYRQRWQIEVFFRFIKQQLNFSHLMSRNENGIKVILYMTLISAILLTVFKNANNLKGYKIPKLKLANQIEELIIADIVLKCGGDPSKINQIDDS